MVAATCSKPRPSTWRHGAQLGEVEFQSQHEHEEYHPEFSHAADTGIIFHHAEQVRADDGAGQQIAQHARQLEAAQQHHPQHGGEQIDKGEIKA